jgi:hypothetical protein
MHNARLETTDQIPGERGIERVASSSEVAIVSIKRMGHQHLRGGRACS